MFTLCSVLENIHATGIKPRAQFKKIQDETSVHLSHVSAVLCNHLRNYETILHSTFNSI